MLPSFDSPISPMDAFTYHVSQFGSKSIELVEQLLDGEVGTFIKVWLLVFISICYCYFLPNYVSKGIPRLVCVLPVVCLFLYLPLLLNSVHLGGITAFFIAWLANFKLLLFAFGTGPLSSHPSLSLGRFIAVACLPIKIQPIQKQGGQKSPINYAVKGLLLGLLIAAYDYSEHVHPKLLWIMYCFHIYFAVEIMLLLVATAARAALGAELEPQFDEPYLSSSLQDFWGRRWNIMVTRILNPTVYQPVLTAATRLVGRNWAPLPAVMGTFVVSAIMHELIFYYVGRMRPTWDVTWFFLLHGVCLVVEIAVKKLFASRKYQLPRLISGPLTVAFVTATVFWLFLPALLRCRADVKAFEEYAAVGAFARNVGRVFMSRARTR